MADYISNEKFTSTNLTSIKSDMGSIWSGMASTQVSTSFDEAISAVEEVKASITTFDGALDLLEQYKDK